MRFVVVHRLAVMLAVVLLFVTAPGFSDSLNVKPPLLRLPDKSGSIGKQMHYIVERQFGADLREQARFGGDSYVPERFINAKDGTQYHEREVRPVASLVSAGAILLRFGEFDEKAVGCSRPETERILISLISEFASHHAVNNPEKKSWWWGGEWQSAVWAADLARGSWILWDRLPSDARLNVARIVAWESDRFLGSPAPFQEFNDTKAEENAWNSQIMALAVSMLTHHPHHADWANKAKEYMVTAFAAPQDLGKDEVVDGKPLKEWLRGPNVHRDYSLENHGIFHPDYLATYQLNAENAVAYRLGGLAVPKSALFNAANCRSVSELFTQPNGCMFYPMGTDWSLYRNEIIPEAQTVSGLLPDPVGTRCLLWSLDSIARADKPGQSPSNLFGFNYECTPLRILSNTYMLYYLFGSGANPASESEALRRLSETRLLPDARVVVCRSAKGIASFSWFDTARHLCGFVVPMSSSTTTVSGPRGLIGEIGDKGDAIRIAGQEIALLPKGGFSVGLSLERGPEYRVNERVMMLALPDGRVVYGEWFAPASAKDAGLMRTGLLHVEDNPFWLRDDKLRIFHPGGAWAGAPEVWTAVGDQVPWLNVANRLGIVLRGAKRINYTKRQLALNYRPTEGPGSGEEAPGCLIAVFYPNATREVTAKANEQVRVSSLKDGALLVEMGDIRAVLNPTDKPCTAVIGGKQVMLQPLRGMTVTDNRK